MLRINDLTYRIGARTLFEGAFASIAKGQKVGIVGPNGSGKTTLFKIISGEASADGGDIKLTRSARFGSVSQEAPSGRQSLLETVLSADKERAALLEEAETALDPERIADIHTRLADIGAHTAESRAAAILSGLGFSTQEQMRPCDDFSGGWRMRVALAAALFPHPDLLLLDEPTNHLDLEAALWLENYLASWPKTLLVISHDRTLLNKVCQRILHLEAKKLVAYSGNYDRFEKTRREQLILQSKMKAKQQAQRKHIQSYVDRFRASATKARQAQSRLKMLARMEPIATVMENATPVFHFPKPKALAAPLITVENGVAGYEAEQPVLSHLDLRIDLDDRIGLLGANGNGKSTLIKILSDRLSLQSGRIFRSKKLKVGYFSQHQMDELVPQETPFAHAARAMDAASPEKVRTHLGRFGFSQDKADITAENLSGGEKARLLFCLMTIDEPQILFLDEPTNHLDVDSREALAQALNDFEGAVILVSHDHHLLSLVCERLWLVDDGGCKPFEDDLDSYTRLLLERRRENRKAKVASNGPGRKERRRERAAKRAQDADLRKSVRKAEKNLEALLKKRQKLEERLAAPEIYNGPNDALAELQIELGDVKKAVAAAEAHWLEAEAALEGP
jgi:ATP-binding cassette, subfamily F, member 3